jgi:hypothetical protein
VGDFLNKLLGRGASSAPSGTVVREVQSEGYRIRLDLSDQVLSLSLPENTSRASNRLEKTVASALGPGFVPASALMQKAKQFDDGLYAAVELAAQAGAGSFAGKAALLQGLIRELTEAQVAGGELATLVAASRLGGLDLHASTQLEPVVANRTAAFMGDELKSKPLGFYTWSPELKAIFRQDRLLQSLDVRAFADVLRADPELNATRDAYLALIAGLTNPFEPDATSLFPASVSHEVSLINKLYGDKPIPEGFDLMNELVDRIRTGAVVLAPTATSGWYDYQTWSHEPFVIPGKMPEAAHLGLSLTYLKALIALFKGAQALARETHVKQLSIGMVGAAFGGAPRKEPVRIPVWPDLSVEPLASYYVRRALGYRHVRSTLTRAFGDRALAGLKRLGPDGPAGIDLDAELSTIESLFWGGYYTACTEIGLAPDPSLPAAADANKHLGHFASWANALTSDDDLGRDARMMVPVFYDIQREKTKVWAFLGWEIDTLFVDFSRPPRAQVFDPQGRQVRLGNELEVVFRSESHKVAYPVMAEVYVTELLDRDEFRRHCDMHETTEAILANLR